MCFHTIKWVGTGRTAERCLPIPPVVTVRAAFTAHGDRLLDLQPLFAFYWLLPGFPGITIQQGCY